MLKYYILLEKPFLNGDESAWRVEFGDIDQGVVMDDLAERRRYERDNFPAGERSVYKMVSASIDVESPDQIPKATIDAIVRKANVEDLTKQLAEAVSACESAIEMIKRADEKDPTLFESMSDEETCQELQQIVERAKRCAHDDDPTDCNQCMIESDIAFDAMRERGSR